MLANVPYRALVAALLFLAGAIGYFVGSRSGGTDDPPAANSPDVRFLQDMIAHHEQALSLSSDELVQGSDTTAKSFAREIVLFQSYEIGLMERQLAHWGYERGTDEHPGMPGMATDDELDALAHSSGAATDALFIALMRDHHAGGVQMAERAARDARDPFVRDLADRMARNQRIEIKELALARDRAGLPADPPGFVPDPVMSATAGHDHGDG